MAFFAERKLIFRDNSGKRFLADDVTSIVVKPSERGYNDEYLVKLHDGDELVCSDWNIIQAHDKPEYIYASIPEPSPETRST